MSQRQKIVSWKSCSSALLLLVKVLRFEILLLWFEVLDSKLELEVSGLLVLGFLIEGLTTAILTEISEFRVANPSDCSESVFKDF